MESQPSSSTSSEELPQSFNVRYLGFRDADGLWGIKYTRKPVDNMVSAVKASTSKHNLNLIKLIVTQKGCKLESVLNDTIETRFFPIETISYGVQDLVYTRVFAMIIVKDNAQKQSIESVFECHAFVCDSRQSARKLTYSLATAFHHYSRHLRTSAAQCIPLRRKLFAIDLRTPEEIDRQIKYDDSEA